MANLHLFVAYSVFREGFNRLLRSTGKNRQKRKAVFLILAIAAVVAFVPTTLRAKGGDQLKRIFALVLPAVAIKAVWGSL